METLSPQGLRDGGSGGSSLSFLISGITLLSPYFSASTSPREPCLQDGLTPPPGDPYGGNTGFRSPGVQRAPAGSALTLPRRAELRGGLRGASLQFTPRRLPMEKARGPLCSSVGRAVSRPQSRRRWKTEWITLSREAWGGLTAVRDRVLFAVASAPTQG